MFGGSLVLPALGKAGTLLPFLFGRHLTLTFLYAMHVIGKVGKVCMFDISSIFPR